MEIINKETRLDLDIYVMGEMKLEFMVFLSECFKQDFHETLSWGNFRRFQLVLSNNENWINIFFTVIKNDSVSDILINCFKVFEKRNFILLMYNSHDKKPDKTLDTLYENLLAEKNKLYDGILKEDNFSRILARITSTELRPDISDEEVKRDLSFLNSENKNLIYKVGFHANMTNKKTKNIKKNDNTSIYEIDDEIFTLQEGEKTEFESLFTFILENHFKQFKLDDKCLEKFLNVTKTEFIQKSGTNNLSKKEINSGSNFMKFVHLSIFLYIIICVYKFYY